MLDKNDIKKLRSDLDKLKETSDRGVTLRKQTYNNYSTSRGANKAIYSFDVQLNYSYGSKDQAFYNMDWYNKVRKELELYLKGNTLELEVCQFWVEGRKISIQLMDIIEFTKLQLIS